MEAAARTTATQRLYDEVQELSGNCVRLFYDTDDLLKKSESIVSRWDPEGLRRHIINVTSSKSPYELSSGDPFYSNDMSGSDTGSCPLICSPCNLEVRRMQEKIKRV